MPIEFRCPNCQKLLRVGDDAAGKQAKCPGCGNPVLVPSGTPSGAPEPANPFGNVGDNPFPGPPPLPPLSTDNPYASPTSSRAGFDAAGFPIIGGNGPAWERDGASFSSLVTTIRDCLSSPTTFFSTMRPEGGLGLPILFYFIVQAASTLLNAIYGFAMQGFALFGAFQQQPQQPGGAAVPVAILAGAGIFGIIMALVVIPIQLFIRAGILHVALMIFGGANRSYETTLRVVAYAGATAVIGFIPFCGAYVAELAALVFIGIGLCYAHNTDGWRAVLAVIAPAICCIGGIIALVAMVFGIAAAGGAAGGGGGAPAPPNFQPGQFRLDGAMIEEFQPAPAPQANWEAWHSQCDAANWQHYLS